MKDSGGNMVGWTPQTGCPVEMWRGHPVYSCGFSGDILTRGEHL